MFSRSTACNKNFWIIKFTINSTKPKYVREINIFGNSRTQEKVIRRESSVNKPIGCGIMFKMDKILEIGLYNPNFLLHEDKELMVRFKKKYKLHNITLPLYRYRMHSTNITHNKENDVFFNNKLKKT